MNWNDYIDKSYEWMLVCANDEGCVRDMGNFVCLVYPLLFYVLSVDLTNLAAYSIILV